MTRWQVPEHFHVLVGGNTYIDTPTIVLYKGQSVFTLKRSESDGFLAIDFDVFGSDGGRVATVRNAQFVNEAPMGFELHEELDRFALTETSTGRTVCEVRVREKAAGEAELEVAAEMYLPDGFLLDFGPTATNLGGVQMTGNTFVNCGAAIAIE